MPAYTVSDSLSGGQLAGIVVGSSVAVLIVILLVASVVVIVVKASRSKESQVSWSNLAASHLCSVNHYCFPFPLHAGDC